jgi:hypothetical protein
MSDHGLHLWHERADGVVCCALMGCDAEPTELEAAETIAEAELATKRRIELDWRPA